MQNRSDQPEFTLFLGDNIYQPPSSTNAARGVIRPQNILVNVTDDDPVHVIDFEGARLHNPNISASNLSGANLQHVDLRAQDLQHTDTQQASLFPTLFGDVSDRLPPGHPVRALIEQACDINTPLAEKIRLIERAQELLRELESQPSTTNQDEWMMNQHRLANSAVHTYVAHHPDEVEQRRQALLHPGRIRVDSPQPSVPQVINSNQDALLRQLVVIDEGRGEGPSIRHIDHLAYPVHSMQAVLRIIAALPDNHPARSQIEYALAGGLTAEEREQRMRVLGETLSRARSRHSQRRRRAIESVRGLSPAMEGGGTLPGSSFYGPINVSHLRFRTHHQPRTLDEAARQNNREFVEQYIHVHSREPDFYNQLKLAAEAAEESAHVELAAQLVQLISEIELARQQDQNEKAMPATLALSNKNERRLKECNFTGDIPEPLCCPITTGIMDEPVTLSSGYTIERSALHKLMGNQSSCLCPFTRNKILRSECDAEISITLNALIEAFINNKGKLDSQSMATLLTCPLTHELFQQPVTFLCGLTLERSAVEALFNNHTQNTVTVKLDKEYVIQRHELTRGTTIALKDLVVMYQAAEAAEREAEKVRARAARLQFFGSANNATTPSSPKDESHCRLG